MAICNIVGCPAIATNKGRCPVHGGNHTGWSPNRDRSLQRQFRNAVLERAGYRCQATQSGHRCNVTNVSDLQAHHTQAGNNDPATGVALCRAHHRAADPFAR